MQPTSSSNSKMTVSEVRAKKPSGSTSSPKKQLTVIKQSAISNNINGQQEETKSIEK